MKQIFETEVVGHGPDGAWVYMTVPFNVEQVFGKKSQVPVTGTINGARFRNSLMPRGDGTHHMHITKRLLKDARAQVGEKVEVVMEIDTVTRTVTIPNDLQDALRNNERAEVAFASLSYSHQKEYVDWVSSAKRPETRSRRIEEALRKIAEKNRIARVARAKAGSP